MPNSLFQKTAAAIAADIKDQLRLQGHYLTGELERSLQERVEHDGELYRLTADALDYIETLETGIPADEITSASLDGLTRYAMLRFGKQGRAAVRAAVAILRKQQQEGNPTRNSYQFSKTGKRTEAIADTFNENDDRYFGLIDVDVKQGAAAVLDEFKSGTI